VCFIGTASGESEWYHLQFYKAFHSASYEPSHLSLFTRTIDDIAAYLLRQDIIYVGGGNTVNMLAIWRIHGVDTALRAAWEAGVVLCGSSAGSICWFEASITDSFGPQLSALNDGLGFLAGSNCPHYDSEARRRPVYTQAVAAGFPAGYAAEDGVGFHFEGTDLAEVVSSRPDGRAFHVSPAGGQAKEEALPVRYLGES
jgi:peptidase E